MEYNHHIQNNVCVLMIEGEFLRRQVNELELYIRKLLDMTDVNAFVVNLEKMTYLSSPGVGVLMTFYKRVKKQERGFGFCHLNEDVHQIFHAIKLDQLVQIYQTEQEAIAALIGQKE